jgi:hypothetical protein
MLWWELVIYTLSEFAKLETLAGNTQLVCQCKSYNKPIRVTFTCAETLTAANVPHKRGVPLIRAARHQHVPVPMLVFAHLFEKVSFPCSNLVNQSHQLKRAEDVNGLTLSEGAQPCPTTPPLYCLETPLPTWLPHETPLRTPSSETISCEPPSGSLEKTSSRNVEIQ